MGSSAAAPAVLKSWRDHLPPSASFLKLTTTENKHESPLFVSGGYGWRLVVYPKRNEEDNGSGFVSMYVELDKSCLSSAFTPPTEVFAYLSFFVFSKKENKYYSVQDVEVKRFDSSRTVWGVSKMLPLDKFNDTGNGFIWDGEECKFGAHVKVASSPPVSFGENLPFHKFSWRVQDFSVLKQNDHVSKTFPMGEKKWTLKLNPKGDSSYFWPCDAGDFSVTLHLADNEILLRGELIFVRLNMKIIDPRGSSHLTGWSEGWVMNSNKSMGSCLSASLEKVREAYLDLEDALSVDIECEILNVIKDHPFF